MMNFKEQRRPKYAARRSLPTFPAHGTMRALARLAAAAAQAPSRCGVASDASLAMCSRMKRHLAGVQGRAARVACSSRLVSLRGIPEPTQEPTTRGPRAAQCLGSTPPPSSARGWGPSSSREEPGLLPESQACCRTGLAPATLQRYDRCVRYHFGRKKTLKEAPPNKPACIRRVAAARPSPLAAARPCCPNSSAAAA